MTGDDPVPRAGARVLLTGGAGFIGRNLDAHLGSLGHHVLLFDNLEGDGDHEGLDRERLIEGDVRDLGAVVAACEGVDHVVHLAAQAGVPRSVADPLADFEHNALGTLNVLLAARDQNVDSVVFASSNAPVGGCEPPVSRESPSRPLSPYGASKAAGEAYCLAFAASYGLRTVVLRFANVYGPGSTHKTSVVAKYLRHVRDGEPLPVHGDGTQTRDFIYVGDLCEAIGQAVDGGEAGSVIHLGTGVETSVLELVEAIRTVTGRDDLVVELEPARPGDARRSAADPAEAAEHLGFVATTTLGAGLAETWHHMGASAPSGAAEPVSG